jgi:ferrous iron transport protein A
MSTFKLKDIKKGDSATILGYEESLRSYRTKLLSMGLTKGTKIQVENVAPFGDPISIKVRDFNLSLRKDEADALILGKEVNE